MLLEINAQPDRLDLPDTAVKRAREVGCRFSVGTDAHSTAGLRSLGYAVDAARRGWLEAEAVLNTSSPDALRAHLDRS